MSERGAKFWLMGLGALTLSGFVAFVLVELAVLLVYGEQVKFRRPLQEVPSGFREDDRGATRIVSLGDAFTIGHGVDVEQTFSAVLARELLGAGHEVRVLNAGVSGFSTEEEALYLERELLQYDPDIVVWSVSADAPVDRSGFFDFMSEHSNAFALLRQWVEREPERNAEGAEQAAQLTAAIVQRVYEQLRDRGIALVIQSIPAEVDGDLLDRFPHEADLEQPGIYFVSMRDRLRPYVGTEQLYGEPSRFHWTPFSHEVSGRALARLMLRERLLGMESHRFGLAQ